MSARRPSSPRRQRFYGAVLGTLFLFGLGGWYAITRQAHFHFGGNPNAPMAKAHATTVAAHGWDAVAIGNVFVALGCLNLALGMSGRARKPVFCVGLGLFAASLLYGLGKVVAEVMTLLG